MVSLGGPWLWPLLAALPYSMRGVQQLACSVTVPPSGEAEGPRGSDKSRKHSLLKAWLGLLLWVMGG